MKPSKSASRTTPNTLVPKTCMRLLPRVCPVLGLRSLSTAASFAFPAQISLFRGIASTQPGDSRHIHCSYPTALEGVCVSSLHRQRQ
eukprot:344303-Chlamydomonas_euryale.AAC.8